MPNSKAISPIVAYYRGNYETCFIDKSGLKMIEVPRPYHAYGFSEGMSMISGVDAGANYGFMDRTGRIIIDPIYYLACSFHEGLAAVATASNKWGFIDKSGNVIIEAKYGQAARFTEGLAAVRFEGLWGFIDQRGNTVIPPLGAWPEIPFFNEGLARVRRNNKWGYIDKKGQTVIEPRYDNALGFSEGLAAAKQGDRWGFINTQGQWVIKPSFTHISSFQESLAFVYPVFQFGGVGYIDHQGKVVIDFRAWANRGEPIDIVGYFQEGLAPIYLNERWGFIDKQGGIAIPIKFDQFPQPSFSEGLWRVSREGKKSYIDKKGNILIETDASVAGDFSEGLADLTYL